MIQVVDVKKVFHARQANELVALEDINLTVEQGELLILKGASGSGKSTLLSLIAALSKPTCGEVVVDNQRISKLPDNFAALYRRNHIGFIFQKFNLIPTLNVFDNIAAPLLPSNLSLAEIDEKAEAVMERFSILQKKEAKVGKLSGGEQQRVAICRALVNAPKIILADEPTANLDAKLTQNFLSFMKQIKAEGKTLIIATHDPVFHNLDFSDREIAIKNGRIQ
ncbi:MAG: ABC transporter ATP-binding protein [Acidobacteria bacterium]|nr:MAG: ABC transporter ATP-binding protein [Acidobacteriota bacterium]